MVPPCSDRIARVPPYSSLQLGITCTGLSPTEAQLSRWFQLSLLKHWPSPRSLATTSGVSVDVLSSGYLDVSVPRVCFLSLCVQDKIPSCDTLKSEPGNCFPDANYKMSKVGFPIRKSTDQRLFAPSRSLSQRTTSFIASYRQGIHQMPLGHLIALISNAHLSWFQDWSPSSATRLEVSMHRKTRNFEISPSLELRSRCSLALAGDTHASLRRPTALAYPLFTMSDDRRSRHKASRAKFALLKGMPRTAPVMVEPVGIEPTT